ncbi:signal transduction histidine kinase [Pedobacter africanus]|uniref:Signal transduction histidine kinase n=1 Tax=Pedobacter africanus TaxID=151894 RepID=A0ACC6KVW2_9SPHI|nr:HAMP domain-containing sensor histidine kinase [Pedobacter africanus]MDR6783263.1 signal transduction histidine kinase [Pedobacter africanus]
MEQPIKKNIRALTVLVGLAIAGILVFQVMWLRNSYHVSKQQFNINLRKAFDETIANYKLLKTDTVRSLLGNLLLSDKDFNYRIFRYSKGLTIGYRNGNNAYIIYPIRPEDTVSIKKDPIAYLQKKIHVLSLEELNRLYSTLIGVKDYPAQSGNEELQTKLMTLYQNLYADTYVLNRISKEVFIRNGIQFNDNIRHFNDVSDIRKENPDPNLKGGARNRVPIVPPDAPLTLKVQALNKYEKEINESMDSACVSQLLLYNPNDILLGNSPLLFIAVKTQSAYVLKKMAVSIVGSLLLMLFLGFCMVFMLFLILKQRKLADMKNDFISNISHELKTPIATTLAAIQGMGYYDAETEAGKRTKYLTVAANELRRLSDMVDKMLSITVFGNGKFEINPVSFDLKEMISSIIANVGLAQSEQCLINLDYKIERKIFADKSCLYQSISNLVDNAVKYAIDTPNILISCREVAHGIEISIQDNGPGIPLQYQRYIFDKFFRVPQTGGHKIKGHGLGLNYVKSIIEKHGGSISLKKSDASGSTFLIILPQ